MESEDNFDRTTTRESRIDWKEDTRKLQRNSGDWFNVSLMQTPQVDQPPGDEQSRVVGRQFSALVEDVLNQEDVPIRRPKSFANTPSSHSAMIHKDVTDSGDCIQPSAYGYPPIQVNPIEDQIQHAHVRTRQNRSSSRRHSNNLSTRGHHEHRSTESTNSKNHDSTLLSTAGLKPAPSCPGLPISVGAKSSDNGKPQPHRPNIKPVNHGISTRDLRENNPNNLGYYRLEELIGTGNFSQVKLATHLLTRELVAIKILDKFRMNASTRRLLMREISILEKLHHPNIVRLYEVMETFTKLHLVMEYVPGGDLNKRVTRYGKFTEPEAQIVFAQLIAAVNHMHDRNIFHRDIKADNILFTHRLPPPSYSTLAHTNRETFPYDRNDGSQYRPHRTRSRFRRLFLHRSKNRHKVERSVSEASSKRDSGVQRLSSTPSQFSQEGSKSRSPKHAQELCPDNYRIKLADFGFSKMTLSPDQALDTFCGSPAYAAPELFEAQSYQGGPVDMWALGIVLFFLVTGLLPYRGSTVGQVRRLVLEDRGLLPPAWLSPAVVALYSKLTARKPAERLTASEVMDSANPKEVSCGALSKERKEELWSSWLHGRIFPKALPRFSQSAPLLSSIDGSESKQNPPHSDSNPVLDSTTSRADSVASRLSEQLTPTTDEDLSTDDHIEPGEVEDTLGELKIRKHRGTDEEQAARQLFELGVTPEEIAASKNMESRSAVTGTYRIILHRVQRARRLSHLDGPGSSGDPSEPGSLQIAHKPVKSQVSLAPVPSQPVVQVARYHRPSNRKKSKIGTNNRSRACEII